MKENEREEGREKYLLWDRYIYICRVRERERERERERLKDLHICARQ